MEGRNLTHRNDNIPSGAITILVPVTVKCRGGNGKVQDLPPSIRADSPLEKCNFLQDLPKCDE